MKITELAGGVATTLRVRPERGAFGSGLAKDLEVGLVRSGDQTLLKADGEVWSIVGVTPADTTELVAVAASGLPILALVAKTAGAEAVLDTRRYTQELRITETIELGLDEKLLEDIFRVHRVGGTVADVAAWLADRLFLVPDPDGPRELRRLVITGDPRERLDAFRIYGHKVSADIKRVNDVLRVERVVRGGRGGNRRLTLLHAPIEVVDATLAAELHGSVRTTLQEAVATDGSYLRVWQDYHRRERENVLRRARSFGSLEYKKAERRRDGGWTFRLAPVEDLVERLSLLGGWDRFELEAGAHPPAHDAETREQERARGRRTPPLSAAVVGLDARRAALDLAPPEDDEDQPQPPDRGYLYLSIAGDEARLRRRERAEEALRTGNCPLPQLGLLMEGRPAPASRLPKRTAKGPGIDEVFGRSEPTPRQWKAIRIALNTPDICLIQGPPGTGKTKVITAIQRRLAHLADEGVEPSHRVLVSAAQHDAVENVAQRTEVFGLPAMKVGRRRRSSDTSVDPAELFAAERVEQLRARVKVPPEAETLSKARGLAVACFRTRAIATEQAARLREIALTLDGLLPPALRDELLGRAHALERPAGLGDPEEAELMLRAARSIRVDAGPFSDDGPIQARKALRRLGDVLGEAEREFLERCVEIEPEESPDWLEEGRPLREGLIDRLTAPQETSTPQLDEATKILLAKVLVALERRLAGARAGDQAAISAYLHDLETDPDGIREALQHYTVVLASTLQQAAGNEMRKVRGIAEGQTTFESVIVDEAARANPLDLFIPLSMALRRVVLVGDHRQLPHLLEPDVERQLAEGVEEGTVEAQTLQAVQASLFERLWVLLRALEEKDGIERTVTLDAQYRMHPVLGDFVSRVFYEVHGDGRIESPREAEEFAHDFPGYVGSDGPCPAAWLDVPAPRGREVRGISKSRPCEARAIAKELRRLIDHDSTLTFGVISFYSEQVDQIGRALVEVGLAERTGTARGWRIADEWASTFDGTGKRVERLRVGTVDAFQGKEFDVVFLSVTRSNDLPAETDEHQRRKYGHLMLENRLGVSMSRQQRLLIAVGDLDFVEAAKPLAALRAFVTLCRGGQGVVR